MHAEATVRPHPGEYCHVPYGLYICSDDFRMTIAIAFKHSRKPTVIPVSYLRWAHRIRQGNSRYLSR